MRDCDMLRKWLEDRGYRMEEEGYRRLTEVGYFGMRHMDLAVAMNHKPELFTHFLQACEVNYGQEARVSCFDWSKRIFDSPPVWEGTVDELRALVAANRVR